MGAEDNYVVHGAEIYCPFGYRTSNVVLPMNHGVILKDKELLTVSDCIPMVNVLTFGACSSPTNPAVQAAAAAVMEAARVQIAEKKKGLFDKIAEWFCKPKEEAVPAENLVAQCTAPCVPALVGQWDNGKGSIRVDGSSPLLGGGTITCMWSTEPIYMVSTGQPE